MTRDEELKTVRRVVCEHGLVCEISMVTTRDEEKFTTLVTQNICKACLAKTATVNG